MSDVLATAARIAARRETEHELQALHRRLDELLDRLDRLADPPRDVVIQWGQSADLGPARPGGAASRQNLPPATLDDAGRGSVQTTFGGDKPDYREREERP